MKKTLIVLSILFLFLEANAQEFKIFLGENFSQYKIWPEVDFTNVWPDDYSYKIRFKDGRLAGIGVESALSRKIAIEVDAHYFQKGGKIQRTFPVSGASQNA